MKRVYKSILILSLLSVSVEARNFKIFVDNNGIDTNFPFEITDDLMFELGYYSNKDSEISDFYQTNREGKKALKVDENNLFVSLKYNIDTIANSNIFLGVEYEKFKRDSEQIGYYKSSSNQLPYNSSVNLKGDKLNIISEAVYGNKSDTLRAYLRATVTPETDLEIEQDTKIYPKLITGGEYKGEATFDLSYKIEGELKWDMLEYVDIGFGGGYSFVPYEYQFKKLNKNNGFIKITDRYDEVKKEGFVKIRLKKLFKDILPTIGYKWISLNYNYTSSNDNELENSHDDIFFVGVETWF